MERVLEFFLVGTYLTDSVVHFSSLRNIMADLWHPIRVAKTKEALAFGQANLIRMGSKALRKGKCDVQASRYRNEKMEEWADE
ncbi:hypothetical protein Gorai_014588 [Gossypium raimondii]|uniref:Uncharacterized protein n=1 Tax=Gossypium raimondii TaxID=29730 RepID=A0A7J8P3F5_GOSRA|nr:hypothetical protein [Gossypium raimondii]